MEYEDLATPFDAAIAELDRRLAEALATQREALLKRLEHAQRQQNLAEALGRTDLSAEAAKIRSAIEHALGLGPSALPSQPEPEAPAPVYEPAPKTEASTEDMETQPDVAEPEPEPASEPEPMLPPVVTKAKVAIKPSEKKAFVKRRTEFFERENALHEAPKGVATAFRNRSLVCDLRGLMEDSFRLGEDFSVFQHSLDRIRREMDGQSFFGLNSDRHHGASLWHQLADAYLRLAEVEEVLSQVSMADIDADRRQELIDHLAASNAYLPRLSVQFGLGFSDQDQNDQKKRLDKIKGPSQFVQWWRFLDDAPPLEQLVKRANGTFALFQELSKSLTVKNNRQQARAEIDGLISTLETDEVDENWVDRLRTQVIRCLENGVRPTETGFRERLLPYHAYLEDLPTSHGPRLLKALKELEMKLLAAKKVAADPEDTSAPDSEELKAVREYLQGKQVLFVGGNTQPARIAAFEKALGIKLEWPGSRNETKLETFRAAVNRADVVCLLIRFSRHAYMDTLAWAKEQGKDRVILKAGIGLNRVVQDMHRQLIEKASRPEGV